MNYFKLFSNCILTVGYNNSLIIDLQRESSHAIPKSMSTVIELLNKQTSLADVYELCGIENTSIINEYVDFLVDNELGHFLDLVEFDQFPPLPTVFNIPSAITNSVIELSAFTIQNMRKIAAELIALKCRHIQLISYGKLGLEELLDVLGCFHNADFRSIEVILEHDVEIFDNLPKIAAANFTITKMIFHSAPYEKQYDPDDTLQFDVITTRLQIESFKRCGAIHMNNFQTNIKKVLESMHHNSCLHKKISIDKDGYIKNCPSMLQSFGTIKDTSLEEAVDHPDFKKYWDISKDQIDVCKDCEFRHICTDCRAYMEEPENHYSKPLKCGYSPYTNIWEEWSTNPLKQKAIAYYGMGELIEKNECQKSN